MQFIPMILMAAAGTMAAVQQRNAGIIQSNQLKAQARVETDAARGREIERRRDLMRALAAQSARAGALGVETSGSIGGIMRTDIQQGQQDLLTDSANTSAKRRALIYGANSAVQQGNIGAVATLLQTGAQSMSMMPGKGMK